MAITLPESHAVDDLPYAKKSLGQHWLTDEAALQAICDAGEVTTDDVVVEIGPGTGTLTKLLVEKAKQVIAIEFDQDLATGLHELQIAKNLQIVREDIRKFDLSSLPAGYKIIANIPYYLTSHLIRLLSETPNPPTMAVLLVQKEVAERVAASPGDMSLLSVSAQYYWHVRLGREVPAALFTPPPKVDSQILILKRREEPLFPGVHTKEFFQIVKSGYAARRKTLGNSLAGGLRLSKEQTAELLKTAQIDPGLRAQALPLEDWYKLYQTYQKLQSPTPLA